MSFLSTLLGLTPTDPEILILTGPGTYALPIVGEINHQEQLRTLYEKHAAAGKASIVEAHCIPHTNQTVTVEIDGQPVGYLNPTNAHEFRQLLRRLGKERATIACSATIQKSQDDTGYRVWLDLP